jgi:Rrf2 family protein
MKLSAASRYALRALAHLAMLGGAAPVAAPDIARACRAPERYLLMAFHALVLAGLLHSVKGPNGGYRLARPAKSISLLEILEAVDGPIRGEVPEVPTADTRLNHRLAEVCDAAADMTRKELGKVRLSDLAGAD